MRTNTVRGKYSRLDHIDGLRALAALYVVIHHSLLYLGKTIPTGLGLRIFIYGHYSVDVFIVLSGFCLMLPVISNDGEIPGGTWNFIRRRARRILPPYYAALAVSLFLIWLCIGTRRGTLWDMCVPVTPAGLLTHLLVIQDIFPGTRHEINHSLWSISVEWRIYFLFPLIIYCWRRFGALRAVSGVTLASYLLLIPLAWSPIDNSTTGVCLHYYGLFSIGMLAAGFAYSADKSLARLRPQVPWGSLSILMAVAAIVCDKISLAGHRAPWQCQDLFVGFATLCLMVALTPAEHSDRWQWLRNALAWAPLVFVGTFSYSLYLLHAPLLEILWIYFVRPLKMSGLNSFFLLSTAGLAVIIALSYLFFLLCERSFMRHGKRPMMKPEAQLRTVES